MHPLIKIAKKRQKRGTGSIIAPFTPPRYQILEQILTIPYAIIGDQATKSYMPERNTLDWDILVSVEHEEEARQELEKAHAHTFRPLSIEGFSCYLPDSTPIDVISSSDEWIGAALQEAGKTAPPHSDPVLPLPWLILFKLQSSRVQDLADVSRMIARADEQTKEKTRQIIKQYLPDTLEDLDSLIDLGELEL